MTKVDFTKALKHLYRPSTTFQIVDVPPMTYLMIDGHGDPNTAQAYAQAVEALYAVAYRIKFISKDELARDYIVPPLEGLWWATDWSSFTTTRNKTLWNWTTMIMVPDWIPPDLPYRALDDVEQKKSLPGLHNIRVASYHEGLAVQIMHLGSYDDEAPILARLHQEWLPRHGYLENGKHHEIYLSDPRRVDAAKLKTVLRQPIRKG